MPYIKNKARKEIDNHFTEPWEDLGFIALNPGELNYIITSICVAYLQGKEENYQTYNNIIDALECAKLELYRGILTFNKFDNTIDVCDFGENIQLGDLICKKCFEKASITEKKEIKKQLYQGKEKLKKILKTIDANIERIK
jgi:hypothetical protein